MIELTRPLQIRIIPVPEYPGMYRVRWPDGRLSPMGNITRAKEAAIMYAHAAGLANSRSNGKWMHMGARRHGRDGRSQPSQHQGSLNPKRPLAVPPGLRDGCSR
jgi:hypothetical protein